MTLQHYTSKFDQACMVIMGILLMLDITLLTVILLMVNGTTGF